MKNKIAIITVLALAILAIVPALSLTAQDAMGIESVCLVTDVGKVNDGTFNEFAYNGMVEAVEEYDLDSTYIETTAQTDYEVNVQTCIDSGFDAVVTVGFLIADATLEAALANPDVYFIGVDQGWEETPDNLVGFQFREDQGGFLAGALAALMTETDVVGGVYGIPVPAVVKFRNGFEQGAKYVNPEITVLGVYIDSFTDSARGAEVAEQLIGEGADVIFGAGGQTGSGGIKKATELGAFGIGVDQDEYFTTFGGGETPGAEYLISSAIKRVDLAVYNAVAALATGDMEGFGGGGAVVYSAENEGVGFAEAHDADVPEEVTEELTVILEGLKTGEIETGVDPVGGELLSEMEDMEMEATEEASE